MCAELYPHKRGKLAWRRLHRVGREAADVSLRHFGSGAIAHVAQRELHGDVALRARRRRLWMAMAVFVPVATAVFIAATTSVAVAVSSACCCRGTVADRQVRVLEPRVRQSVSKRIVRRVTALLEPAIA